MFQPPSISAGFVDDALERKVVVDDISTTIAMGDLSPGSETYDVTSGFFLAILQRSSEQTSVSNSDHLQRTPKPCASVSRDNDDDGDAASSSSRSHRYKDHSPPAPRCPTANELKTTATTMQLIALHNHQTAVAVPCVWETAIILVRAAVSHMGKAVLARRALDPLFGAPPAIRVLMRRAIRKKRIADALGANRVCKPSSSDLKRDALLKMYPDAQLEQLVSSLTLDYMFPNESIIVRGLVERDCYFLHSGTVGVVIGGKTVATLPHGSILGAQGMLSGEPRTASIIAREACFVWRTTKDAFDRGVGARNVGGANTTQSTQAFSMARELRQRNFRQLHQSRLTADFLGQFQLFHGISQAGINSIVHIAEAIVLTPGEVLSFEGRQHQRSNEGDGGGANSSSKAAVERRAYFILKGRVMVQWPSRFSATSTRTASEEEVFAHFAETLPDTRGRRPVTLDDRRRTVQTGTTNAKSRATSPPSADGGEERCTPSPPSDSSTLWFEWSAPVWLGAPSMLLMDQEAASSNTPDSCRAMKTVSSGYCDAISLSISTLHQCVKPKYVHRMLRNMLAIRKRFMAPLSHEQLLATLFPGRLSMHFLRRCFKETVVTQAPAVYAQGDLLEFYPCGDGGRGEYAAVVLEGHLVDASSGTVVCAGEPNGGGGTSPLWPPMHLVHFGDRCSARAGCRLECIMVKRSDILNSLIRDLSRADQETYAQVLSSVYATRCGRKPVLNCSGLTPVDDSPAGERSRYFQAVHEAQAKIQAPVHIVSQAAPASTGPSPMMSVLVPSSPGRTSDAPLTPSRPTSQQRGESSGRSPRLTTSGASQWGSSMSQSTAGADRRQQSPGLGGSTQSRSPSRPMTARPPTSVSPGRSGR